MHWQMYHFSRLFFSSFTCRKCYISHFVSFALYLQNVKNKHSKRILQSENKCSVSIICWLAALLSLWFLKTFDFPLFQACEDCFSFVDLRTKALSCFLFLHWSGKMLLRLCSSDATAFSEWMGVAFRARAKLCRWSDTRVAKSRVSPSQGLSDGALFSSSMSSTSLWSCHQPLSIFSGLKHC